VGAFFCPRRYHNRRPDYLICPRRFRLTAIHLSSLFSDIRLYKRADTTLRLYVFQPGAQKGTSAEERTSSRNIH